MKPRTSLRELVPVQPMIMLIRRTPQLVLSMMTGSENTAMMKKSAGLAKPLIASPRLGTIPSTGHMTMMNRAVTPSGRAEVTHSDTSASMSPRVLTPSAESCSEPGMSSEATMQSAASPMPTRRFDMGTLVFSIWLVPPCVMQIDWWNMDDACFSDNPLSRRSRSSLGSGASLKRAPSCRKRCRAPARTKWDASGLPGFASSVWFETDNPCIQIVDGQFCAMGAWMRIAESG